MREATKHAGEQLKYLRILCDGQSVKAWLIRHSAREGKASWSDNDLVVCLDSNVGDLGADEWGGLAVLAGGFLVVGRADLVKNAGDAGDDFVVLALQP